MNMTSMRLGIALALVTLVYGFGLGAVFGAAEGDIKDALHASADAALESGKVYDGDTGKAAKVVKKSWSYMKRAHLHANGIGTTALVVILLLGVVGVEARAAGPLATALGAGSLGYSTFWMFSGILAPGLGSTGAAKDAMMWLAVPSAAACLIGLVGAAMAVGQILYARPSR